MWIVLLLLNVVLNVNDVAGGARSVPALGRGWTAHRQSLNPDSHIGVGKHGCNFGKEGRKEQMKVGSSGWRRISFRMNAGLPIVGCRARQVFGFSMKVNRINRTKLESNPMERS